MKMTTKQKKTAYWISFALLTAVLVFLCFFKLDAKYVDPWDEARHGVNAYEMLHGGSIIQSTYRRQADYYNLKPPLSMWCIMIGLKLFSNPVLGLRFYSALSYLLLSMLTALFLRRISPLASLFTLGALTVNMTPFLAHMVRAGDADSLYCLLFTAAMLAMLKIRENHRFLYLCGFLFSLAFLTKSFHAMTIAAVGGLFLLLTRQLVQIRLKEWGLFLTSILVPVLCWGLLRYRVDQAAFFVKMWETDVLGRTLGALHSNPAPFGYYLEYYLTPRIMGRMQVYTWALLVVAVAGIVRLAEYIRMRKETKAESKEKRKEGIFRPDGQLILGLALWILVPLLSFSAVSNKLLWYVYPSVTGLMIAAGIGAAELMSRIFGIINKPVRYLLTALFPAALGFCFIWYAAGIFHIVNAQSYNEFQILVRATAGDRKALGIMEEMQKKDETVRLPEQKFRDCEIYTDYDNGNVVWSQQDVFVAQAFGNYTCRDGGVAALLVEPDNSGGLVFADRATYEQQALFYEDYSLVAQTPDYLVFEVR